MKHNRGAEERIAIVNSIYELLLDLKDTANLKETTDTQYPNYSIMSFQFYKNTISEKVLECSVEKLNQFCADVLNRILLFVDNTSQDSLNEREQKRVNVLIKMIKENSINWEKVNRILDELTEITMEDDIHAIEIDMEFVEFLSAMGSWSALNKFDNHEAAFSVSESLMNILDFYYGGDTSSEEWLTVKELNEELKKQIDFLNYVI